MASQSERRNAGTRGPGSTRDRVLDAYETLLIEQGPGGATLDAVAAVAEVSKGGLLYHFSSKEALVSGLLARLRERSARDAELMRSDAAGTVAYYLRTSVPGHESPVGLTRTYLATLRVADGSSSGRPPGPRWPTSTPTGSPHCPRRSTTRSWPGWCSSSGTASTCAP